MNCPSHIAARRTSYSNISKKKLLQKQQKKKSSTSSTLIKNMDGDGDIVDGDTSHATPDDDDDDAALLAAATTDTLASYATTSSTARRCNSTDADEDDEEKGNKKKTTTTKKPGRPKHDQQATARNSNSNSNSNGNSNGNEGEEEQSSSKPVSALFATEAAFNTHAISTKQLWCGNDNDDDDDDDDASDDIILILNTKQDHAAKLKTDDDNGAAATAATTTQFEDTQTKQADGGPDGRNDSRAVTLSKAPKTSARRSTSAASSTSASATAVVIASDQQQQQQQQQQEHPPLMNTMMISPGAYAIRGINTPVDVDNGLARSSTTAAALRIGRRLRSRRPTLTTTTTTSDTTHTSTTEEETITDSNSHSIISTGTNTDPEDDNNAVVPPPTELITAHSELFQPPSTNPRDTSVSSSTTMITAQVVDEVELERLQQQQVDRRVRDELLARKELEDQQQPLASEETIVQAEIIHPTCTKVPSSRRCLVFVSGIIVAIIIAVVVGVTIGRGGTGTQIQDNNNTNNSTTLITPPIPPSEQTSTCVGEKMDDWIASNTTLQKFLENIMTTDLYRVISDRCRDEIEAYTQAAENSCRLEKEYDSPWSYGNFWINMTTEYKIMNEGSDNGAFVLDGAYELASILYATRNYTVLMALEICFADCFAKTTGRDGCSNLYSETIKSAGPTYDNFLNLNRTTAFFVEQSLKLTPDMYCKVEWGKITQATYDLATCGRSVAHDDSSELNIVPIFPDSKELYAGYEDSAREQQATCGANAYCPITEDTTKPPLPQKCGQEKLQDFMGYDTWLQQHLEEDVMATDWYQIAAESCREEIDAYTDIAELSCQLEIQYNSPWNYGDFSVALSTPYTVLMDGLSTNGAVFSDGRYTLATMFDFTANFTLPIPTLRMCVAACFMGDDTNGCDIYELAPPEYYNPLGLDYLFTRQTPISSELYCAIEWKHITHAYHDLKICAAKVIGNPIGMTLDQYVCYFKKQQILDQQCANEYCGNDYDDEYAVFLNSTSITAIDVETDCQLSLEQLTEIYESEMDWDYGPTLT